MNSTSLLDSPAKKISLISWACFFVMDRWSNERSTNMENTCVIWYLFVSILYHSCTEEQNDIWHASRQLTWYILAVSCGTKGAACCEARTISRPHRLHQSSPVQATLWQKGAETLLHHTHKLALYSPAKYDYLFSDSMLCKLWGN